MKILPPRATPQSGTSGEALPTKAEQGAKPATVMQSGAFVAPALPPSNAKRIRRVEGTPPEPQVDLSSYTFFTLRRPDGRTLQIERFGEIAIPDILLPGGVELPPLVVSGTELRLHCYGDTGKGTAAQFEVAKNIVAMADERGCHASMHLGDIIYPAGILGPRDQRIQDLYIKPYGALREPHAVLGNHEYGNHEKAGIPEAWVEASALGTAGICKMPQRYYSRRILVDGMTVRTLFLDSSTIAVDPIQIKWLKGELEKGADYTLVFGHHPIYSGGLHGSLPHMEKLVLPMLEQYADAYICGHDHNLQFLRSDKGLPLVVSGSAGEERLAWSNNRSEFFSGRMGTCFVKIDRRGIDIDLVNGRTREVLFTKHLEAKSRPTTPQ